jgi:NodT family efflux transporter outer membrane factor (OMF) lipoprotein
VRRLLVAAAATAACALSACSVAPEYRKPELGLPVAWKLDAPWRESAPADAADKGRWWERFGDPELSRLVGQALANNQTLAAAAARLGQARASLAAATANLYPQLSLSGRAADLRISANRPLTRYNSPNETTIQNDITLGLAASYEPDLFGRVRSAVEGAGASAEQSAADLENARLIVAADVATAYFGLQALDIELDVLARSIALQRRALDYVSTRRELGAASGLEVAQQRALIDNTLVQIDVLRKNRAQFEHAIATLIGVPAPEFSLPAKRDRVQPPAIPLGVPSDVLERRPDVAAAERAMAAANAQIGVAKAAFYPSIVLGPQIGYESTRLDTLFNSSSLLWSLGVSVLQPLFNAGRLQANVDFTRYGYEAVVANYRRTVLTAMQEVQDGISGTLTLESAQAQAQTAIASAARVLDLANARYEGGVASYLDVISAQQGLLSVERQASQLQGQRLLIAVFLVKALGGDWRTAADSARESANPGS